MALCLTKINLFIVLMKLNYLRDYKFCNANEKCSIINKNIEILIFLYFVNI